MQRDVFSHPSEAFHHFAMRRGYCAEFVEQAGLAAAG
jgi:hypothetical protein